MNAAVTFTDVSVSFFGRRVLAGINAFFPANKVSVLVGRSGSGKTTLLRVVNRLNEEFPGCVTSGRVAVDFGGGAYDIYEGCDAGKGDLAALRLRAGMLFQTPNCFPVSVFRNIAMPLSLAAGAAKKEIPDRVEEALRCVGLWDELKDRLDSPAERLSGGQQQRLCLARLLALRPDILLLDEPTASLDIHAAREIEDLVRELAPYFTVIMVSHELRQARALADRALVCEAGEIIEVIEDRREITEERLAALMDSRG